MVSKKVATRSPAGVFNEAVGDMVPYHDGRLLPMEAGLETVGYETKRWWNFGVCKV